MPGWTLNPRPEKCSSGFDRDRAGGLEEIGHACSQWVSGRDKTATLCFWRLFRAEAFATPGAEIDLNGGRPAVVNDQTIKAWNEFDQSVWASKPRFMYVAGLA
jgi:hypothetical protein